jgi:hypothetical protein
MRKSLMLVLVLLVSLAFVSTAFAQAKPAAPAKPKAAPEKPAPPAKPAEAKMEKPAAKPEGGVKAEKPAKPKPKAKLGFGGSVMNVNTEVKLLTVKGARGAVTFDVSRPEFKGYKSLSDVKLGDKVAVKYKGDTTKVWKLGGKAVKAAKEAKPKKAKAMKEK